MSVNLIDQQTSPTPPAEDYTPPLPPTDLIFDDGEPLESNRHRIAMNALIELVHQAYQGREDYFAGGNMFIYYSSEQVRNKDFKGPDFFVTLDVDGTRERLCWVIWEEGGRYPDVIIELMSPSTANQDTGEKKRLYEKIFRTPDYFVYNPFERESLRGWHLGSNGRYEELTPDHRGWLWCESLGLWLGLWDGTIGRETASWLRFYDRQGNLILLAQERAEREQERAELAQQQAERERQEKEQAQQLAERERQEKEQAQQLAEQYKLLLSEHGIDLPDGDGD